MTTIHAEPSVLTALPEEAPALNADQLATARDVYDGRHDYKFGGAARWRELEARCPELAEAVKPKPDKGSGSGKYGDGGKYWREDRARRMFRRRRPNRKPTSDQTMRDGSPLRIPAVGELDVDHDAEARADALGWEDRLEVPRDDESALGDLLGSGGRVFRLDGIHGERIKYMRRADKAHQHQLEHCVLCGHMLPLKWPEPVCEFAEAPMPEGVWCRCNGCMRPPSRSEGRVRYCSDDCAARMDNAMDRARRRSEGKPSRPSAADGDADRLARFRIDMRDRARQDKAAQARYRFDWTGVWAFAPRRPERQPRHLLTQTRSNVWEITLTNA